MPPYPALGNETVPVTHEARLAALPTAMIIHVTSQSMRERKIRCMCMSILILARVMS